MSALLFFGRQITGRRSSGIQVGILMQVFPFITWLFSFLGNCNFYGYLSNRPQVSMGNFTMDFVEEKLDNLSVKIKYPQPTYTKKNAPGSRFLPSSL